VAKRRNRDLAGPALALAGAGVVAGAAVGGALARRRRGRASSPSDAKLAARRLLEAPWRGNWDVIDELVADTYVGHDPAEPDPILGPAGLRASAERYVAAFPGGSIAVGPQFADGDTVVTRWTGRGVHTGELSGIAPTGREVTVEGITVSRIEGGRIVEEWTSWDRLGLLVQLGAITEPAHA
jgi:predicted ester cyclase